MYENPWVPPMAVWELCISSGPSVCAVGAEDPDILKLRTASSVDMNITDCARAFILCMTMGIVLLFYK